MNKDRPPRRPPRSVIENWAAQPLLHMLELSAAQENDPILRGKYGEPLPPEEYLAQRKRLEAVFDERLESPLYQGKSTKKRRIKK